MPARRLVAAGAVVLAAVTVGAGGCSSTPSAAPAARTYLSAWSAGQVQQAAAATDAPTPAGQVLSSTADALHLTKVATRLGKVTESGDQATATFQATLSLAGLGDWTYDGRLALRRTGGTWKVHWQPSDVHPRLTGSTHLAATRKLPDRATIEDGSGRPLLTQTPVVHVGLEPARLSNPAATYAALHQALGIDVARLKAAVQAAQPHAFVPVITLRRSDYEQVRAKIHDLAGTVFQEDTEQLAPTSDFARALLGRVGTATAAVLKDAGPAYRPGDPLGIGGLEQAFQTRLAGKASGEVDLVDAHGSTTAVLHRFAGQPGQPVQTTLDRALQSSAERALHGVKGNAALVAVRPSDGHVLAVANTPADSTYDRALVGHYPPGSTFKVVTTYALLGAGVTPSTTIDCPPTVTVDGRTFHNFEGEASGPTAFRDDFAQSCNTAFIGASRKLDGGQLASAAKDFGFGASWKLPVPAFTGSVPTPSSVVEKAADAIGQGKVQASPLVMAMVAAAADTGTWRPPVLVTDPSRPAGTPHQLDPDRVHALQALMQRVVTSGTAASAGLPPGTSGKTGTAEFGTDNPPKTHAWFIAYRGDLAVAVLVEGGGVGGRVAAPIAARLLRAAGTQ